MKHNNINAQVRISDMPFSRKIRAWIIKRYGNKADRIWAKTVRNYYKFLREAPDYGGKNSGHAKAIYGGMLVFAWYAALPDKPPISELQPFVENLFFNYFTKLGKFFDLNRPLDMALIDKIFRMSGDRDRKDILKYPAGFVNIDEPYDKTNHISRYSFTQCPNAEFAKSHGLLHVLPLLCNCDYFGISELHGTLIRCGTCGNSSVCDYCVVGSGNPLAEKYETVTDEYGFIVSRKKDIK